MSSFLPIDKFAKTVVIPVFYRSHALAWECRYDALASRNARAFKE